MKTRTMEVAIGVALFVASLILVVGLIWLSEQTVGWRTYELTVAFETAVGLKRGDAVTVVGIKIGKVDHVVFRSGRAEVHILLNSDQKVPRDSRFVLDSGGLLGGKIINIFPGEAQDYFVNGETVIGSVATGLMDLGPAAVALEERLRNSLDSLFSPANLQNLGKLLQQMQSTSSDLEGLVARNRQNLDQTLEQVRRGSTQLASLMEQQRPAIDTTLTNLETASQHLAELSRQLAQSSLTLQSMSQAIERQQGTLGALIYDRQLYDNLNSASRNLNTLIDEVMKNPQRYLNLSVF